MGKILPETKEEKKYNYNKSNKTFPVEIIRNFVLLTSSKQNKLYENKI